MAKPSPLPHLHPGARRRETICWPKPNCTHHLSSAAIGCLHRHISSTSIEETIFVQSMRTAQLMGVARGAALGPVASRRIPVFQNPPASIKKAATGDGGADKDRVSMFVRGALGVVGDQSLDETDAMARSCAMS